MSMIATTNVSALRFDDVAPIVGNAQLDDIVEVNLLLPSGWAAELLELSRERGQSIGQVLRSMIGQALHDASPSH